MITTNFKNFWQESSGDYQNSPWTAYNASKGTTAPSTTPEGWATTQTSPQTAAPQSDGNAAPAPQQATQYAGDGKFAYDPNKNTYGVNTGGGYEWLPTYDAADFGQQTKFVQGWNPAWGDQETGQGQWEYDQEGNRGYNQSYYGLTDAARSKYGDLYGGSRPNNWQMEFGSDPNAGFNALLKSGDKEGTKVQYSLQNGKYVPKITGMQRWDTNDAKQNIALAKLAMTGLSMGALGPALQGLGGALEAGTMPTLGQIGAGLNTANTFSGGQIPGLREAGLVTSLGTGVSGLTEGLSKGINSVGDAFNLARSGVNVFNKGSQVMNMFSGPDEYQTNMKYNPQGNPSTAAPMPAGWARTQGPENMPQGGGNWLDALTRMGAGAYSEHQNRAAFTGLNDLFSRVEQQRQPYIDKLRQSYEDPSSYFQGPEYQAMKRLEEDRLARSAGKTGRLANDIDRAALLQDFAAKNISNYRQGLTQSLGQHQLPYSTFDQAMRRKGNAGGAAAGGLGYGNLPGILGGSGTGNLLDLLKKGGSAISDLFNSPSYGNFDPSVDTSGAGDSWDESLMGGGGPNYGNTFDMTTPENWNWDNADSWDFTNWFDDGGSFWGIE